MTKPTMFIGSSTEGKLVAELIQLGLEDVADCDVWHQGVFGLSSGTLETLVSAARNYDFAVLVLTADDLVTQRNVTQRAPRDNVLFELGLFMGVLGRDRTFVVHSREDEPLMPSDLAGVTCAKYSARANMQAALGPTCSRIKLEVAKHGCRPDRGAIQAPARSPDQYSKLENMISEQHSMLASLLQRLTVPAANRSVPVGGDVSLLVGHWRSDSGSIAVGRLIGEQVVWAYSYQGEHDTLGRYYAFTRVGNEIFSRFNWLDSPNTRGFAWWQIEGNDRLSGAWWIEDNVPFEARDDYELLKKSKGMNRSTWIRQRDTPLPDWTEATFARLTRENVSRKQ